MRAWARSSVSVAVIAVSLAAQPLQISFDDGLLSSSARAQDSGGGGSGSDGGTGDGGTGDGGTGDSGSSGGSSGGAGGSAGGSSGGDAASAAGESGPDGQGRGIPSASASSTDGFLGALFGALQGNEQAEPAAPPSSDLQPEAAAAATTASISTTGAASASPPNAAIEVRALPDIAGAPPAGPAPGARSAPLPIAVTPLLPPDTAAATSVKQTNVPTSRRAAARPGTGTDAPKAGAPGGEPVTIIAEGEAWIQVSDAGRVVFEGILSPGEDFMVPPGIRDPRLWTGNAGAIFLEVGQSLYGPVGQPGSVVRRFPIGAQDVATRLALAETPGRDRTLAGQGGTDGVAWVEDASLLAARRAPAVLSAPAGEAADGPSVAGGSDMAMSRVPQMIETVPAELREVAPIPQVAAAQLLAGPMNPTRPDLSVRPFFDLPAESPARSHSTDAGNTLAAGTPTVRQALTDAATARAVPEPAPVAPPPVSAGTRDAPGLAERSILLANVTRDESTRRIWLAVLAALSLVAVLVAAHQLGRRPALPKGPSREEAVNAGLARLLGVAGNPDEDEPPLRLGTRREAHGPGGSDGTSARRAQAPSARPVRERPVAPAGETEPHPLKEVVELSDREISEAVARAFNRLETGKGARRRA